MKKSSFLLFFVVFGLISCNTGKVSSPSISGNYTEPGESVEEDFDEDILSELDKENETITQNDTVNSEKKSSDKKNTKTNVVSVANGSDNEKKSNANANQNDDKIIIPSTKLDPNGALKIGDSNSGENLASSLPESRKQAEDSLNSADNEESNESVFAEKENEKKLAEKSLVDVDLDRAEGNKEKVSIVSEQSNEKKDEQQKVSSIEKNNDSKKGSSSDNSKNKKSTDSDAKKSEKSKGSSKLDNKSSNSENSKAVASASGTSKKTSSADKSTEKTKDDNKNNKADEKKSNNKQTYAGSNEAVKDNPIVKKTGSKNEKNDVKTKDNEIPVENPELINVENLAVSGNSSDDQSNENVRPIRKVALEDAVPSRSVTVKLYQYLDVIYPGAGWVYLGEVDENKNLVSFFSRDMKNADTSFVLRAKTPGTTILQFYKQDVLTGLYLDDFLEVTVLPDTYVGKEHCEAPSYADVVPPNQQKYVSSQKAAIDSKTAIPLKERTAAETTKSSEKEAKKSEVVKNDEKKSAKAAATVNKTIQMDESGPKEYAPPVNQPRNKSSANASTSSGSDELSGFTADQLLEKAKKAYKENQMNDSLDYLNAFFDKAVSKVDEGLYLKGQLYESSKASFKNIRVALESYQELTEQYPESSLWKSANNRITYINRFYFNGR